MWRFPLVRVLPFFVAGIVAGYHMHWTMVLAGTCGISVIAWLIRPRLGSLWIAGAVALLLGYGNVRMQDQSKRNGHYLSADLSQRQLFSATLSESMRASQRYDRYVADVTHIGGRPACGKILIGIPRTAKSRYLPGDRIVFSGQARTNGPPQNPGQFEYGSYLSKKSIYATMYLKEGEWARAGAPVFTLRRAIAQLHRRVETRLRTGGMHETELQVLMALLLGKQQDIPRETLQDYQYAGAVHILSVSGLHVGLMLGFVHFALGGLPRTRRWNGFRFIIALLFLWGFATLAGLSPSVVRSATMFSFVAADTLWRRDGNILHTLFLSMLLILLVEPSFLFDAGFQLSYLSLFFIVWLQAFFDRLLRPRNRILRYFWNLLTVSFSAQLGVLPLSLYYFHQFPGSFFLTNLIVLPALGIIMAGGLLAVVLAASNVLPEWLCSAMDTLIHLMNSVIHYMAGLDVLVFRDIPFDRLLLVTSYAMVFTISALLLKRQFSRWLWAGISVVSLQSAVFVNQLKASEAEFIVLNLSRRTELIERKGAQAIIHGVKDSDVNASKAYLMANFVTRAKWRAPGHLYYLAGRKIFRMDSTAVIAGEPDVLILTQSPKINLERLLYKVKPEIVIADGSNFKSAVARWKATCEKRKIPFHATAEKGFYALR